MLQSVSSRCLAPSPELAGLSKAVSVLLGKEAETLWYPQERAAQPGAQPRGPPSPPCPRCLLARCHGSRYKLSRQPQMQHFLPVAMMLNSNSEKKKEIKNPSSTWSLSCSLEKSSPLHGGAIGQRGRGEKTLRGSSDCSQTFLHLPQKHLVTASIGARC